ncbi:hypothetical protein AXK58_19440 [Tsukamurella tyrosinosolvens]|nr:hypothetical protein AXK58_19440 [Tsukamurella tyrosinosolvens]
MTARWPRLQALAGDRQATLDDLLKFRRQITVPQVRMANRRGFRGAAEGLAQLRVLVVLTLGVMVAHHEVPIS